MTDIEPLWTIEEVSAYLRVPVATLYQWRTRNYNGPRGGRAGRYVRYKASEVIAWFEAQQQDAA